jgi:malonyl-CoA O-methyltransferase
MARRFARAGETYAQQAHIQRAAARSLVDFLIASGAPRRFESVLEFGAGTGELTRLLCAEFSLHELCCNDLHPHPPTESMLQQVAHFRQLAGDIEYLPLPNTSFDLVAANAVLHWLHNPGRLLQTLQRTLKPGGWLACTAFGPETCRELLPWIETPLAYPDIAACQAWFENGWQLLHASSRQDVQKFESGLDLLAHLRATGVNSLGFSLWTPGRLRSMEDTLRQNPAHPGKITLTYQPIFIIARRVP